MSFTIQVQQILQYAYNIFASSLTMLYLFVGASLATYILAKLLNLIR